MKNYEDHQFMHQGAHPKLFYFARLNREKSTEAEKVLWENLRLKRLNGFKFRRQHPLGKYIADFYCHKAKIVIEIDGGYHQLKTQKQYDEGKNFDITTNGIQVLRFTNEEVLHHLQEVLEHICTYLKK